MAALGCLSVCPPSVQAGCPVLGLAVGLSSSQDTGSYPTTPSSFPIPRPMLPVRGGGGFAGDVAAVSSWGERSPPGSLPRSAVCSLLTFISWGASYSPNI